MTAPFAGLSLRDVPAEVTRHASFVLLDSLTAIVAGSTERPNRALLAEFGHSKGTSVVYAPGAPTVEASVAAFLNGTAGTTLEVDEGHRPAGHPAIYVTPTLLALADAEDISGAAFIETLIAAYEVVSRLAAAITMAPDTNIHAALGVIGAAVVRAKLAHASPADMVRAIEVAASLTIAGPFASGPEGATVRNAYAGAAAVVGSFAWHLTHAGYTAPADALGLAFARLVGASFRPEALAQDANRFLIAENYFKRHACCRYIHPALDAMDAALAGRTVSPMQVKTIYVTCEARAAACANPAPANPLAARFSLPFALATRLVNGHAGPGAFSEAAVADERVLRLARAMHVEASSVIRAGFYPASVELRTMGGEIFQSAVTCASDDPPAPPNYPLVARKFGTLVGSVIGNNGIAAARDAILSISEAQSARAALAPLVQALAAAPVEPMEPFQGLSANPGRPQPVRYPPQSPLKQESLQ